MQTDKAADKIAKLLRLADKAGTPEEAATAFSLAQKMMTAHAITEAQARAAGKAAGACNDEPIVSRIVYAHKSSSLPTWIACLASAVCAANGCAPLASQEKGRRTIKAWGTSSDLTRATDLLASVIGQIDAMAKASWCRGRTALNNFRLGAMEVVCKRIEGARKEALAEAADPECEVTAQALALVKSAGERADAVLRREVSGIRKASSVSFRTDRSARNAGRAAGSRVNVSGGRALR